MDADRHRELTGVSNEQILKNLRYLSDELRKPVWIRMPLIRDINDSVEEMRARIHFVKTLKGLKMCIRDRALCDARLVKQRNIAVIKTDLVIVCINCFEDINSYIKKSAMAWRCM